MATVSEEQLPPLPAGFRPPLDRVGEGCGRPVGIGCGCLGMLLIGCLLMVQWQQQRLLDWSVGFWQRTLLAETEGTLTEEQSQRVEQAFEQFRVALGSSAVEWDTAVEINQTWTGILSEPREGPLRFQQILPLLQRLEALPTGPTPESPESSPDDSENEAVERSSGEVLA